MHPFRQRLTTHLRFRGAAYVVLLVALVPTLVVFWRMREVAHERDEAQFRHELHI